MADCGLQGDEAWEQTVYTNSAGTQHEKGNFARYARVILTWACLTGYIYTKSTLTCNCRLSGLTSKHDLPV